ncbi:hypothetical protein TNCV_4884111 [Trichonephila clavipes]|nr:hypothetical protein TNCV_4884111 [Trichonephila clavipes]
MALYRSPLTVTLRPSSFLKKFGPMIPLAHKVHQTVSISGCVSEEAGERVADNFALSPQKSTRIPACKLGIPHKMKFKLAFQDGDRFNSCQVIYSQFGVAIHQNDHQAKRRFVEWAQYEIAVVPDFHKRILFSDEAHFWLNGYVNKQNCRIWSEANPQVYVETPLHPEKLTV